MRARLASSAVASRRVIHDCFSARRGSLRFSVNIEQRTAKSRLGTYYERRPDGAAHAPPLQPATRQHLSGVAEPGGVTPDMSTLETNAAV